MVAVPRGCQVQLAPFHFSIALHFKLQSSNTRVILFDMTKLLEQVIERLRRLPKYMQDSAARALISQLDEEPEPGDRKTIDAGRRALERGDFYETRRLEA